MATDKYPRSNKDGSPKMKSTSPPERAPGTATDYKTDLALQFDVLGNWIPAQIEGATPFAPKATMYNQLASAVDAIERGRKSSWDPSNLISGMNTAPLNVTNASIDLLEICRLELMSLDKLNSDTSAIDKNPGLSAHEKTEKIAEQKEKIAAQKEYVFGLLEDIRNANAREKNWESSGQWYKTFCSSLAKKFGQSFNKTNFAMAILTFLVCATLNFVIAAASLAALGAFAPYALPFAIIAVAIVGAFWVFKGLRAIFQSGKEAYKEANTVKTDLQDKLLNKVAALKKNDLMVHQKERDDAKAAVASTQSEIVANQGKLQQELRMLSEPIQQRISVLDAKCVELTDLIAEQRAIISSLASRSGGDTTTRNRAAQEKITEAQGIIHSHGLERARAATLLNELSPPIDPLVPVPTVYRDIGALLKIQPILAKLRSLSTALEDNKRIYNEKETAFGAASASAQKSEAHAKKAVAPGTPKEKTLKERLGDATGGDVEMSLRRASGPGSSTA